MNLGVKLRQFRYDKNWSQAEAADKLGVTQPAYHLWETDQVIPTTENLLKISEVFQVNFLDLLKDIGTNNVINSTVYNGNIQPQYYPTIHNAVPDGLLKDIQKTQEQIAQLYTSNNELLKILIENSPVSKKS